MKNAKEFYEVYDIPHPHKLLPREELLFETLTKSEQTYRNKIKSQESAIFQLSSANRKKINTRNYIYAGIAGVTAGLIFVIGLFANSAEKDALQSEVETVTNQKEQLQKQFNREKEKMQKRIEIITEQKEQLEAADAALLEKENAQLKDKNARLNSEIIKLKRNCLGKVCIR